MERQEYSPLAIANYFLKHHNNAGLDHMKLQKLVYCAHGWWTAHRADKDGPLLRERPQVWRYGPVFSSLYHVMKPHGQRPIKMPQSVGPWDKPDAVAQDDQVAHQLLDWIWERYGHLSGSALSKMTHKNGTPWHRVAEENNYSVSGGTEIPDAYIKAEFTNVYESR